MDCQRYNPCEGPPTPPLHSIAAVTAIKIYKDIDLKFAFYILELRLDKIIFLLKKISPKNIDHSKLPASQTDGLINERQSE
jgi:hypothetical protein